MSNYGTPVLNRPACVLDRLVALWGEVWALWYHRAVYRERECTEEGEGVSEAYLRALILYYLQVRIYWLLLRQQERHAWGLPQTDWTATSG